MKTLLTHPCNEKTAGSGIVCGCIFRALQCVESISGISKDVGNNNVQFTGRRAILGLKILISKTRFRHKRLLRRAVADLSSCYCRIACFYAKQKKSGLRFRPVRDTCIGHDVVSNSVGSCSTGSLGQVQPGSLGHVSNSATFQLGQFESIGHVAGHVRGHVQNRFLKFF